jgi:transposase
MARKGYPPEFRRRALDLVAAGKSVAEVARLLEVSDQSIYTWRRQELIDRGELPGLSSAEREELRAARKRIRELETELAVYPRLALATLCVSLLPSRWSSHREAGRGTRTRTTSRSDSSSRKSPDTRTGSRTSSSSTTAARSRSVT